MNRTRYEFAREIQALLELYSTCRLRVRACRSSTNGGVRADIEITNSGSMTSMISDPDGPKRYTKQIESPTPVGFDRLEIVFTDRLAGHEVRTMIDGARWLG